MSITVSLTSINRLTFLPVLPLRINPARLGIPRRQPGDEYAVTRRRSRYYREPLAPAGGGSTLILRGKPFDLITADTRRFR